ncbi:MAG: hypothetical protein WA151_08635 [Desulfatirhabdiaceae bacterium]
MTAAPNPVQEIPYSRRIIRLVTRIRLKAIRKKIVGGRISKKSCLMVLNSFMNVISYCIGVLETVLGIYRLSENNFAALSVGDDRWFLRRQPQKAYPLLPCEMIFLKGYIINSACEPIYCFGEPVDQQSGDRVGRLQPTADGQYATLSLCPYVLMYFCA